MSHPYRGVYRISLDDNSIKKYNNEGLGLPSELQNHLFFIRNEVLVCAESGVYKLNQNTDQFEKHEEWSDIFYPNEKVRRLFQDKSDNVWFVTNQRIGLIEFIEEGMEIKPRIYTFPEIFSSMNAGWESMSFYDASNAFIPTISGVLHFDYNKKNNVDTLFSLIFTSVTTGRDYNSSVYNGYGTSENNSKSVPLISYNDNSIKFRYTSTETGYKGSAQYRWKLMGPNDKWDKWSVWSSSKVKEFTNLKYGSYEFMVQCRNDSNAVKTANFKFEIHTPWYHTLSFRIILGIGLLLPIFIAILQSRQKYITLKEEVVSQANKSEKRIEKLTREKILSELEHKKRELISSTVHLSKKQEALSNIKNKLSDLSKKTKDRETSSEIKKIVRIINAESNADDQWEHIMLHFNQYDKAFIDKLRSAYPQLNNKDLKICTYLRMNLSTKEISNLLNVSVRSVEAYRYRLRKKMNLSSNENLTEMILTI